MTFRSYNREMAEYTPSEGFGSDGKAIASSGGGKAKGKGTGTRKKREKDPNAPKGFLSLPITS